MDTLKPSQNSLICSWKRASACILSVHAFKKCRILNEGVWKAISQPPLNLNPMNLKISRLFREHHLSLQDNSACRRFEIFRSHHPERLTVWKQADAPHSKVWSYSFRQNHMMGNLWVQMSFSNEREAYQACPLAEHTHSLLYAQYHMLHCVAYIIDDIAELLQKL